MKVITKIALGVGSAGTLAGTGLLIGNYYSGSTIKQYIEDNKKSKNKIFLTSKTPNLSEIQGKYKTSTRTKPKKDGKVVSETEIAKWCEEAVNNKFTDENSDDYKGIVSWCYINTNTLKEELTSNKKEIVSSAEDTDQAWKDAWKKYKLVRDNAELKIVGTGYEALAAEDEVTAGKAMGKWCKAIHEGNKKLYEDHAEKDYDRFIRWCSKDKE